MMQCLKYNGKAPLKMYPTLMKVEPKTFTQLWEKFGKNLPGKSKHTHDEMENPPKKVVMPSKQGETTMLPPKARTLKHIEFLELSSDNDFSSRPIQTMGKSTLPHFTKSFIGF